MTWLGRFAFLVFILWMIGPVGVGIVGHLVSKASFWALVGGTFASFTCGSFVAGALVAPDEVWWRRAAFGLPALAGVALLSAWEPVMLYLAASGALTAAGFAAWERFKGPIPDWVMGEHPPAS